MASNIKRPIQIFNGTDWDKILPEISEDMIKSGWTQNLVRDSGYKKMPGGLIVQWGRLLSLNTVHSSVVDAYRADVTFPISFPTILPVIAVSPEFGGGIPTDGYGEVSLTKFCVYTKNPLSGHFINWIAIGC